MNLSHVKLNNCTQFIQKAQDKSIKMDTSLANSPSSSSSANSNQNVDNCGSDLDIIHILIYNNSSVFNIDPQFDNFTYDCNLFKDELII